jgi:hypothetical protein
MNANIRFLALSFSLLFSSCDIIDDPIREIPGGGGTEVDDQRVLIEKFTGHRCNNCPDVDPDVNQIKDFYGDKVSFISYHVFDNFAGINARFPKEFRTQEGNFLVDFFRIVGIPMGMVNRIEYTSSGTTHRKPSGAWPAIVANELNREATFKLSASATWNPSSRSSQISVEIEAVSNYDEVVEVVVSAIENGIVSPQYMPDNTINDNYVHESVFRFSYTPVMGEVFAKNWRAGDKESLEVTHNTLSSDFDEDNMKVVVYVKNAANQNVLQVAEISLVP